MTADSNKTKAQLIQELNEARGRVNELEHARSQYRRLAHAAQDLIFRVNVPGGHFEFVNDSCQDVLGYPPEVLEADPDFLKKCVHPDSVETFSAEFGRLVQGNCSPCHRYRIVHPSKGERLLEQRNSLFRDPEGKPIGVLSIAKDITHSEMVEEDQARARESLGLWNFILDNVLDHIPGVIVGLQLPDHTIVRYNTTGYEFLGLSPDQIRGKKCFEIIGRTTPCSPCASSSVLKTKEFHALEKYVPELDTYLDCWVFPILNEQGEVVYLIEMLRDISRRVRSIAQLEQTKKELEYNVLELEMSHEELRKTMASRDELQREVLERNKAEQALRDSEANYRAIVDNTNIGIMILQDHVFQYANPAVERISGWTSQEMLGKPFLEFVHPDDHEQLIKIYRQREQGTPRTTPYIFQALAKGGGTRWIEQTSVSITWKGAPATMLLAKDVTEHMVAEAALKESDERYRELVESAASIILRMDKNGVVTFFNEYAEKLFGFSRKEILGRSVVGTIVPETETTGRDLRKIIQDIGSFPEKYESNENENILKDGTRIWVSWTNKALYNDQGQVAEILCVGKNITEQKKAEKELARAKQEAEAASQAKSDFLARMSHEIRTPLNAILGMTDATLNTELDSNQEDYLETVRDSADHLLLVINDILDISKIEAQKLELVNEDFDLHQVLHNTMRTLSKQAEKKELFVSMELSPDLPQFVHGDLGRLRQILFNLVGNAIKFTQTGGVTVSVDSLSMDDATANDSDIPIQLLFAVQDTGIGIAEQHLPHIFDTFTQAELSTTRRFGGSGLGLAITKRLVAMMGGDISVESRPSEGSLFTFTVTFGRGDAAKVQPESSNDRHGGDTEECYSILLVEDNPMNVKVAMVSLRSQGHQVAVATNGEEALRVLKNQPFDLVLMDVEMPSMDGITVTRMVREGRAGDLNKDVSIIAMTAHAMTGYRDQCLAAGMNEFVAKPVNFSHLAAVMFAVVGGGTVPLPEDSRRLHEGITPVLYNKKEALERLGNKHRLLDEAVSIFFEELPEKLKGLELALEVGEYGPARLAAHTLKSQTGTLGAESCRGLALRLEQAVETELREDALQLFAQLQTELERLRDAVNSSSPSQTNGDLE
ncbi:MAG: PAS domain S-box protein [Desulfovibrio sp.]|nr:MAG: PAS domain S-box protein [Desulfovibrio sp.]